MRIDPQDEPVWDALEGLRSSAVVTEARAYASERQARRERRRAYWASMLSFSPMRIAAAALCLAMIVVTGLWSYTPKVLELATHVGEIRTEQLADGSRVVLDTDTQIRVTFTGNTRHVRLVQGQAHFDVAHDASRPFKVAFGQGMVTAIGTSFDVTAFSNNKAVTLLGGRVMVEGPAKPSGNGDRAMLNPGQQVTLAPDGLLTPVRAVDLGSARAWQQGRIDLVDLPLSDALVQVNRYSTTKIVVQEPSLSHRRISGVFQAGDVNAVATALCVYFDLRVVRRTRESIVIAKHS
ncbi:FecR family protein [Sphingobium sp. EM0848]|uniref:FecR family protein n=1 Tax=Sphingobium sp. EM0848 TaxID=2743473 RepID=UPI00159C1944|nr:FecR domain-containing protein [Sphingobium sp. EM0848]